MPPVASTKGWPIATALAVATAGADHAPPLHTVALTTEPVADV